MRIRWGRGAVIVLLLGSIAACKKPPHPITDQSETFTPPSEQWNGIKVYLSAPRHIDSGSRGECGWEENINGRIFNLYAAGQSADPPGDTTLTARGYDVRVSANSPVESGWRLNRDESDNWGANVHLVTHSNAWEACKSTPQYLLVMFRSGNTNSTNLTTKLLAALDPKVPGGQNSWNCDGLGECSALAPHVAYIELFFHTNQAAVDWFQGPTNDPEATGARQASPMLGLALDEHLGYPEPPAPATYALDDVAGFGRSPEATERDQTIALWEAFEREQSVAACMAHAGFTYQPAVAFPTEDVREIADRLGIDATRHRTAPAADNQAYEAGLSPAERERYNQTLLGESAADVDEANRTDQVPHVNFATGGCFGGARAAVPGVWDAPRHLNSQGRPAPSASEVAAVRQRYTGVMARIQADRELAAYLATQITG
jgi:hypothetical protein